MTFRPFLTLLLLMALALPSSSATIFNTTELIQFSEFHSNHAVDDALEELGYLKPYSEEQIQTAHTVLVEAYRLSYLYLGLALDRVYQSTNRSRVTGKKTKLNLIRRFRQANITTHKSTLDNILERRSASHGIIIKKVSGMGQSKKVEYIPNPSHKDLVPVVYAMVKKSLQYSIDKNSNEEGLDKLALGLAIKLAEKEAQPQPENFAQANETLPRALLSDQRNDSLLSVERTSKTVSKVEMVDVRKGKPYLYTLEIASEMYQELNIILKSVDSDRAQALAQLDKQAQQAKDSEIQRARSIERVSQIPTLLSALDPLKEVTKIKQLNSEFSRRIQEIQTELNLINPAQGTRSESLTSVQEKLTLAKDQHTEANAKIDSILILKNLDPIFKEMEKLMASTEKNMKNKSVEIVEKEFFEETVPQFLKLKQQSIEILSAAQEKNSEIDLAKKLSLLLHLIESMVSLRTRVTQSYVDGLKNERNEYATRLTMFTGGSEEEPVNPGEAEIQVRETLNGIQQSLMLFNMETSELDNELRELPAAFSMAPVQACEPNLVGEL